MNKLENADIKRLEEEEAFRLKTHEAKKNLQRQKKATQKLAHEKLVSRTMSRTFTSGLKNGVYRQLADVGFFYNNFSEVTLKTDVLPWLFNETEMYLKELNEHDELPNEVEVDYIKSIAKEHADTINDHNQARDNAAKVAEEED